MPDGAVRIAVVTHGPASSKFWAIIRNGVDAAARRLDVLVDYKSPDVYQLERMSALIDEAVATKPDGLVVSIPRAGLAPAIRRAVQGRHPGRLDQLGQRRCSATLGVLAHVGQVEDRAGLEAGRRLADAGVRRALCVNQQVGNTGTRRALRGPRRRRCARSAGPRACSRSSTTTRARPGGSPRAVDADRGRRRARHQLARRARRGRGAGGPDVKIGTFDLGPDVLKAVEAGQIDFAVDQQAYLQGYLPIEMLALRARYGIFPSAGRRRRHGPALRHPRRRGAGARAERALDSLGAFISPYLIAAEATARRRRRARATAQPVPHSRWSSDERARARWR